MKIGALDRRSLAIALAFGVATAVAGCGSKEEPTPAASTPPPAAVAPAEPAAAPTPVAATDVADKTWTAEALEDLLAPIALYPDPVLPDAALRRLDSVETRAAIAMPEGPSIVILREQVAAFTGCKILRAEGNARIAMDQLAGQRVIAFRSLNLYSCAASWFTDRADRLLELHRIGRVAANPAPHPESASPGGSVRVKTDVGSG